MSSGREDDEKVSEVSEEVPDEVDEDLSPSEPGGGGDVLSERDDLDWTTKTEEEEEAKLKETEKESHPPPAEPSPSPAPIEETHRPTPQPPSNLPGPSHVPSDPKGNDSPRPSTSNAQEERMERTQSDDDIEELRKQWYAENDNQEEVESGQAEEEKEKDTEKADEKKASEAAQTEDPKGRDKGGERDLPKPAETDAEDTKKKEDTPSPPSPARSVATPEEDKKAVSTTQDAEERKLTEREDERPAAPAKEELSEPLPFPPQKSDSPSAGKESEREAHLQSPEKDEQGKTNVEESQNSPTESPLPNARHAETPPSERVQKDPHPSDKQDSEIKKNLADEQGGQKEFAPSASSKDNVADDATKQEKEKRLPSDLPKAEGHDGTEATEKDSLDEEIEEDVPVPSNAGDAEVAERDLPEGRVAEGKETTEVPKEPVKNESGVETPEEEKKTGGVSADKKDNVERNSEPIDQVKEAPKQTDTPGAASAKREEKQEEEKEGEKRPAHVSRERSLSALEAELTQEEEKAEGKGIKDQGKELSTEKDEETLPLKDSGDPTPAPLSSKTPEVSDSTDGVAQPTPPPETSSGKPPLLASHAPLARLGQRQQAGGRASDPPADPSEAVREREKERERAIRVEKEREMEKAVNGAVNLFAKIRPDGRAANGSTGPTKLKALDSRANKSLELMKSEREAAKAKTKELEENEDDNKDKDTPLDALNSSVRRLSFGKSTQAEGVSVHGQNEPASPSVSSRGKKEQDSRAAAVAKSVSAADAIFLQLNPRDVLPPFAVGPGVSASGSANFDKAIREAARLPLEASAELVRVLVQTDADTLVGSAERSAAYAQAKRGDVGRQGGGTGARTEFGEGQAGLIRVFQVLLAKFAKGHATLRQRVQGGREKLQSVQASLVEMRKVKAENGLLHRRLRSAGINDCRYLDAVEKNRAAALIQNKVRQKLAKVTATRLAGEIVLAYRPGTLENESRPLSNSELVFKLQKKLHMRGLTLESAFRAADRGASGMLRVSDYLAFLHRVAKISLRLSEMLQILGLLRSPTGIYRLQNIAAGAASSGAQSSPGRKIDPSGRSKRKIVQEDADVQRRKARAADLLQRPGDFPEAEKKVRDLLEGEASLLAFTFDKCEQLAYAFGRSELEILSLHESEERERETGSGDMTTTGRMRDSPSPLVGGGFTNSSAEGQGMEILGRVQRATEPSSPSKSASKRDLHQLPLDDQGEKRMEESQQIQKAILPFLSHDDLKKFNTTQTGDGKGTLLLEGSFHFTEKDGAASRQIGTPAVLELTAALQDKFVQRPDGDSSTGGGGGFSWSVLVDSAERGRLKADADRLAARVVRLRNEARDRNSASSSPGGLPEDPEMAVREARRLRTLCEKLDSTDVFTKVSSASLATHLKTIRQAAPPVTIFAALRTVEYMDDATGFPYVDASDLQRLVDTAADPLQTSPRAASTSAHDHLSNHHAAGGGGAGGAVEGAGEGSQAQGGSSAWGGMIPGRRASVTSNLPYRAPHIPPLKLPAAANNSANDNTRGWQASAALPGGGAEFGGPTVGFRDSVLPTFGQRQSALLQAMNSPAPGLATGGAGLHADGGSYRGSVRGGTPVHPSPQSGPLSSPLTGPTW